MPQITTISEARELVGRTFERDGKRKRFVGVDTISMRIDAMYLPKNGSPCCPISPLRFDVVSDWLSGATEVHE